MSKELVLILGGVRSGKSALAVRLARQAGEKVLFVATAEPGDPEMAQRIRNHRRARPPGWHTLEEPLELPATLERLAPEYEVVLVDCLTLWTSNLLLKTPQNPRGWDEAEARILKGVEALLRCFQQARATFILVSGEVGMGIVPPTPLGRRFRDVLGRVNQRLAPAADRVYLVVAGLALELKSLGALPVPGPGLHPSGGGSS